MSLLATLFLTIAAATSDPCRGTDVLERTTYQMGTLLRVRVEAAERSCGSAAVEAALAEVARLEGVLSSWMLDSEIGRVNGAPPAATVELTPELASLLAEAGGWVEETRGAFDPAVGALIDAWDLRGAGRVPSAAELAGAKSTSGWHHAQLTPAAIRRGPAGWWLDTGAFGKGAALRAAATVLRSHGIERAVLDFGGQLLVLGETEVGVAHPRLRQEEVARVRAREGSVSTTSSSERFVEVEGGRLGHVLDPRTGRPVEAWGSVTVLAKDAVVADALSTALFVMGREAALEWAATREEGVLVLWEESGRVRADWNEAMSEFVLAAPGARPDVNTRGRE